MDPPSMNPELSKDRSRIAVLGAGSVGSAIALCLILNPVASEILLVDPKTELRDAQVKDLSDATTYHGAVGGSGVRIRSGTHKEAGQCDVVVISAGAKQRQGESRTDLLGRNLAILGSAIKDMKPFRDDTVILLVANPVDVLTYFARKFTGLPEGQVIGSGTFLDSARLRGVLAEKAGVDAGSVDAYVLGEHGETQLVAWSLITIGALPLDQALPPNTTINRKEIAAETKDKAAKIIEAKGATAYGIAALTASICKSILFDQRNPRHTVDPPRQGYDRPEIAASTIVGLKAAEQILRKNPNHADTQAMKALIINSQGQTEEAFALAKIALNNNMKSHVCWHVYGLLYRAEKNFEEAIKAYKFALRLEPDSAPIQRDLAHLQIQMRDYEGYISSRRSMLQQKPGIRQNWTALAIAHHLAGNYEDAENVLTTFEDTLKTKPSRADTEHWEAVLYKNSIIAESGELQKALEHLDAVGKKSSDVQGVLEIRADYLARLGRKEEAEAAYAALLDRNSDNSAYYDGYISAKGLTDGPVSDLRKAYEELAEKYPKADLPKRRLLDVLSGDDFKKAADSYLQRFFHKGIPSTFANIKQLYIDSSKKDLVQDLVEGYASGKSTQSNGTAINGDSKTKSHFESSVLYFLAQHYNYKLSRNLEKALEYADKLIELDPKSVDYHSVKARTYKHKGDVTKAAEIMDHARSLDEKDRAINTKAAKYLLRADQNEKALETAGKFTQNKSGGPLGDLIDMQAVWYLTEDGKSYLRQRKLGLALKRFHQVLNIFDIWQDDQFDFHNFSLRKGMIRAYIDMLRWEDRLRDHPFFASTAIAAAQAYILLFENPDLQHGPIPPTVNGNGSGEISAAERKKVLKKAKREQEKMEKAEADKKAALKAAKPTPKSEDVDTKKEDKDPFGKALVETKEPLKDALKFLTPLLEFSPQSAEVQAVAFELYIRKKKLLLAAKALIALDALDSGFEKLPEYKKQLSQALSEKDVNEKVVQIVKSEAKALLQ